MIYHCEDHTCNYWDEGEKLPERCPQCGRKLLRANEADMTGDDWTALGNTLWDAEASDKKRSETSAVFPPQQSLPPTRGSIQPCGSPANTTASETVCPNEARLICGTLFGWRLHQQCFTIRR